jgi:hypothetical protein
LSKEGWNRHATPFIGLDFAEKVKPGSTGRHSYFRNTWQPPPEDGFKGDEIWFRSPA